MNLRKYYLLFTLLSFLIISNAHSFIYFADGAYPELATSGRGLAMGNAYISKVDDSMAAWYNPAGLGTVRFGHFHLSNLHVETNKGWLDAGTGGSLSSGSSNFTKSFKLDGTRQLLLENKGSVSYSRFHFMPNLTLRFFTAGYLYSNRMKATIGTEPDATFEFAKRTDHGPYFGFAIPFGGGIFKVGTSVIFLNRKEVYGDESPTKTVDVGGAGYVDWSKGSMWLVTSSAKLTLPWKWIPSFSAKINNMGGQKFSQSGGKRPLTIKQSIDLAFSVTPQIGKIVRFHFEIDYKDLGHKFPSTSDTSPTLTGARRFAIGGEIDFARVFFLRFGYGDGYGSAGIGIRAKKLEFDLTTYAVDTSSSAFRGKEDRRFSMSVSTGF